MNYLLAALIVIWLFPAAFVLYTLSQQRRLQKEIDSLAVMLDVDDARRQENT